MTQSHVGQTTPVLPPTWEDIYVRLQIEPNSDGAWHALEKRVAVWARACLLPGGAQFVDDAIAETCTNVVLGFDHARGARTFSAFVYGHFLNVRRRMLHLMHRPLVELTDLDIEDRKVGAEPGGRDFAAMWRALEALPTREATAVRMRYVDGHSASEIAATLGTSNGNARQIVHQGVQHLRRAIGARMA
ncbi:MAG: hypothetical protein NVSMB2_04220 [Chloroflexota bacterium]